MKSIPIRQQAIFGAIIGIGATIFVIMSFSDVKYVGIEEDDSISVTITEKHLLVEFSEKAKSLAHYQGPRAISLENIKDAHLGMPEPELKMSRVIGVGAKELKTGHWSSDRGEEYLFLKNLKDDPIITIELSDEKYDRLVLETKDAQDIVNSLKTLAPLTDCIDNKILIKGKCVTIIAVVVVDDDIDNNSSTD